MVNSPAAPCSIDGRISPGFLLSCMTPLIKWLPSANCKCVCATVTRIDMNWETHSIRYSLQIYLRSANVFACKNGKMRCSDTSLCRYFASRIEKRAAGERWPKVSVNPIATLAAWAGVTCAPKRPQARRHHRRMFVRSADCHVGLQEVLSNVHYCCTGDGSCEETFKIIKPD